MQQRRISQLCHLIVWDVRCAACRGAVSLYIVPDGLRRAVARTMKISPYDWLCLECLTGCIKPDASVDDLPDLIQSIESLPPPLPNDTVPFKGIAIACTSTDLPSITAVEAKKDDPRIYRHMVIFAQGTSWHQQTIGVGHPRKATIAVSSTVSARAVQPKNLAWAQLDQHSPVRAVLSGLIALLTAISQKP